MKYSKYQQNSEESKQLCELVSEMILYDGASTREIADILKMPKSTLHWFVHNCISKVYPETYCKIQKQLSYNQKHLTIPHKYEYVREEVKHNGIIERQVN